MNARSAAFKGQQFAPGDPNNGIAPDQAAAFNRQYGAVIGPSQSTRKTFDGRQPVRLHYAPFLATFNAITDPPVLLIPSNQRRCSFLVQNPSSTVTLFMSYGFPVGTYTDATGTVPLGLPQSNFFPYTEFTGMTSIDDIWVWVGLPTPADPNIPAVFPVTAIGYEATLAQEGGDLTLYGAQR